MPFIQTRESGVSKNVTGTDVGSKRAMDVNIENIGSSLTFDVDMANSTMGCGRQTVSPAGTEVKLYATPTTCSMVYVQALYDNTGYIAVGTTPVVAASPSQTGIILDAGEKIPLEIDDISKIYIDSTVNSEGVSYLYLV